MKKKIVLFVSVLCVDFALQKTVVAFDRPLILSGNSSSSVLNATIKKVISCDGLNDLGFGPGGVYGEGDRIVPAGMVEYLHSIYPGGVDNLSHALVIQPDGKIILVGRVAYVAPGPTYQVYFAIVRFTEQGFVDETFGANSPYSVGPGSVYVPSISGPDPLYVVDTAFAVTLQDDGKIIVAGTTINGFAVVRLTNDGNLDITFGKDNPNSLVPGTVWVNPLAGSLDAVATGVAIQADGKIVLGGFVQAGSTYFAAARLTSEGLPDETFGAGNTSSSTPGTVYIPGPIAGDNGGATNDKAYSLALQADGSLVLGGTSQNTRGYNFALARLTSEGMPDLTFGATSQYSAAPGTVYVPCSIAGITGMEGYHDEGTAVAIQRDGKIVLAGTSGTFSGGQFVTPASFAVARFLSNGLLDTTFGGDNVSSNRPGTLYLSQSISGSAEATDTLAGAALQNDGKIVLIGSSYNDTTTYLNFGIARLTTQGALDASFGPGSPTCVYPGTVYLFQYDFGGNVLPYAGTSVAIAADWKILLAGYSQSARFALASLYNSVSFPSYQSAYTSAGAGLNC